jgi:hypothetical protein
MMMTAHLVLALLTSLMLTLLDLSCFLCVSLNLINGQVFSSYGVAAAGQAASPYFGPTTALNRGLAAASYSGPAAAPYSGVAAAPYDGPAIAPYGGPAAAPYSGQAAAPYGRLAAASNGGQAFAPYGTGGGARLLSLGQDAGGLSAETGLTHSDFRAGQAVGPAA